jgi:hypothetical protein
MISEIRRFTDQGNSKFIELLAHATPDVSSQAKELCKDPSLTKSLIDTPSAFLIPKTRLELGANLWAILGTNGSLSHLSTDPLVWNWIACALMEHTVGTPADLSLIGAQERWVVNPASRKFYRHLFAGAFFTYRAHQDNPARAMSVLCQDLARPGEVVAQIMATDDLGHSVAVEVATLLYFDSATGRIKKGVSGAGPGSPRRLTADYLNQLKLTVDFKGMSAKQIIDILPSEFDHLKP